MPTDGTKGLRGPCDLAWCGDCVSQTTAAWRGSQASTHPWPLLHSAGITNLGLRVKNLNFYKALLPQPGGRGDHQGWGHTLRNGTPALQESPGLWLLKVVTALAPSFVLKLY